GHLSLGRPTTYPRRRTAWFRSPPSDDGVRRGRLSRRLDDVSSAPAVGPQEPALVDGNERLGWLATAALLEINGIGITHVPNDAVYDCVVDLAAGSQDVA